MALAQGSAGLVPEPVPLDGLTEIRVHGVGGTSPESMLGDLAPTRVAGDRVAGFFRTRDARDRHREAYSWGGLTSRSRTRALWALLLPSMFANMAGWMARRWVMSGDQEVDEPATIWVFRWFARLAALALTLSTAVMVTMLLTDVVAYQCGGSQRCRRTTWWTPTLDRWLPVDQPGHRILVGAAAATLVALVFALLARHTRSSYERVEPPTPISADQSDLGAPGVDRGPEPSRRCAAAQEGGLRHPDFWSGLLWHVFLSRLHLSACLGVVGLLLGWSVAALGGAGTAGTLGRTAAIVAGAGLLVVMVLLAFDDARPALATAVLVITLGALVLAAVAAASLPTGPGPAGMLPGSRWAVNLVWGASLFLLLPLAAQQVGAWIFRLVKARQLRAQDRTIPRISLFPWAAPFVLNTVALIVANTVLLSAIVYVGRVLGTVTWGFGPVDGGVADPAAIYIPEAVGSLASLLSLGLVALFVAFGIGMWVAVGRSRRVDAPAVEARLRDQYEATGIPLVAQAAAPRTEPGWWRSAFDPPLFGKGGPERGGRPTRWVRKVAMMRFVGDHSRAVAIPLVVMTMAGVVGLAVFLTRVWILDSGTPMFLVDVGTTVAVAFPPLYVLVLASAWRNERWRRVLGSLFDVGSFFPRAFHPFAPPAYAERAVPELTRRIWRLHDNGGRVVLTAHSQGSVIAAAVVGRRSPGRADGEPTVGVVTLGSPLGKLYRWAFPALFSDGFLAGIADGRAGIGPVLWQNVYYATDYIGGAVRTGDSTIHPGVDLELVDPPTHRYVVDQPLPRVLSHTGYWSDDAFWAEVEAMCDRVVAADPPRDTGNGPAHEDPIAPDPRTPVNYL
ncbi:hypothetical protein [uncultured Cellulomonas sp.]|uniref:hypothetical protein n=1 Tax=uncultured Cellulomonas sp. TaxID=189682 RepID=UPI0028E8BE05|nr:hypothetical protein [uncultured Cellulomonas sp.]